MRHQALCVLLAASISLPAHANEVLVLKWPGSAVGFDDAKLQKTVAKQTKVDALTFADGEVMFPKDKARDLRVALIERLTDESLDACVAELRPHIAESMVAYAIDQPDFWIAIPLDGKANDLHLWKWSSDDNALKRIGTSCPE